MKCPYCGGEMGLEAPACPYCGRPNDQSVQHVQAISRFNRRFEETRRQVLGKAQSYSRIIVRAAVLLVLVISCVVMAVIAENAYSMPENSRRRAAERNVAEMKSRLDGYLAEGDYISFASTIEYNGLYLYGSSFSEYTEVNWCAASYRDFVLRLENIFLQGDREAWAKYEASSDIRYLCSTIKSFEDSLSSARRNLEGSPLMDHVMVMRRDMQQMLSFWFGIEDPEAFFALSENRMAAAIEEVVLGE